MEPKAHFFFFYFLFFIGGIAINNVIVSGGQQRISAIHIHVPILPQSPFPSRLSHNTEQRSLCVQQDPVGYPFKI